jgi:hypothetical protein
MAKKLALMHVYQPPENLGFSGSYILPCQHTWRIGTFANPETGDIPAWCTKCGDPSTAALVAEELERVRSTVAPKRRRWFRRAAY